MLESPLRHDYRPPRPRRSAESMSPEGLPVCRSPFRKAVDRGISRQRRCQARSSPSRRDHSGQIGRRPRPGQPAPPTSAVGRMAGLGVTAWRRSPSGATRRWRGGVWALASLRHDGEVTHWEYARLEYRATGTFGNDQNLDWNATFHFRGAQGWGTDERFDDLRHLNRAGADGWQVYDRSPRLVGQPQRLNTVTYSMRRIVS